MLILLFFTMDQELIHLLLPNQMSYLSSFMRELKECSDFKDVTLKCEDGTEINAHKSVISAFSPMFRDILNDFECSSTQPSTIYLIGINSVDIDNLLERSGSDAHSSEDRVLLI